MSSAVNAQKYQTLFTPAIAKQGIGDGHAGIAANVVSTASEGPDDFDEAYCKIIQTLAIHLGIAKFII
jgi:hypothetical protein